MDVEQEPIPFRLSSYLDCIVYANVIEYLRNPWSVIRQQARALAPNGILLISFTEEDRRKVGPCWSSELQVHSLDLESICKRLTDLDLIPYDVHTSKIFHTPPIGAAGVNRPQMGLEFRPPFGASIQHVLRVGIRPRQVITIAATMLRPVGGVSDVRVADPIRAIATDARVSASIAQVGQTQANALNGPRIFIFHRPILVGQRALEVVRHLMANDFVLVTEFDDHPDYLQGMDREGQLAFSGVHAVQTTTSALAEVLRTRNPEVAVFPNATSSLPDICNFEREDVLTFFFGALNRERDWAPYLQVLNEVSARFGPALRFSIVHDRALFTALQTSHKVFTPTCNYKTYLELLGKSEISFMPLGNTAFNQCKSDLKFVEAGASRVTALASRVMYSDSIIDGQNGVLFASQNELRLKLSQLLTVPNLARDIANAGRNYVSRNRMLAYQVAPRLAWYHSLWEQRSELTGALINRLSVGPRSS